MSFYDPAKYETVDERLGRFWTDHPGGRIATKMLSGTSDLSTVIFYAAVYFDADDPCPKGEGHAFEVPAPSGPNKTAHLENAETSAIGRALANCGYGGHRQDTARPSIEEMEKVARGDGPPARTTSSPPTHRATGPRSDGTSTRIRGAAPRGINTQQLIADLIADGWSVNSGMRIPDVVREIEFLCDGERIPTNEKGGWWPSDVWDFVAGWHEAEASRPLAAVS